MSRSIRVMLALFVCLGLVGTTAPVALAKPDGTPQAGKSPVYQFRVSHDGGEAGKLTVNTAAHRFVFVIKGLEADDIHHLRYTAEGKSHTLAVLTANKGGNAHLVGRWMRSLDDLRAVGNVRVVSDTGPLVAVLTWGNYSNSCRDVSGIYTCDSIFWGDESTGPIVRYSLSERIIHIPSGAMTSKSIYQGPDPNLGSVRIGVPWDTDYHTEINLFVYDSAGNSATDQLVYDYPDCGPC